MCLMSVKNGGGGEWGDSPPGPSPTATTTACARNSLSGAHSVRGSAGSGPSRVKTHLRPMIRRAGGRSECFGWACERAKFAASQTGGSTWKPSFRVPARNTEI